MTTAQQLEFDFQPVDSLIVAKQSAEIQLGILQREIQRLSDSLDRVRKGHYAQLNELKKEIEKIKNDKKKLRKLRVTEIREKNG